MVTLLLIILVVAALILTLVDAMVPTRPSWLLNAAVFMMGMALLVMLLAGAEPLEINAD